MSGGPKAATPGSSEKAAPISISAVLARLSAALNMLEGAIGRRLEADEAQTDLHEAFVAMQDDRAQLALDLDDALTRANRLACANEEVARRLEALSGALQLLAQGAQARENNERRELPAQETD